MNFTEARPIGGPGNLEAALTDLDRDPQATIARAHEPDVEEALARDTRAAIERGMFGSLHFLVGEELFWGDDRLEDAIAWCVEGRLAR